jgi:hypothetical protein
VLSLNGAAFVSCERPTRRQKTAHFAIVVERLKLVDQLRLDYVVSSEQRENALHTYLLRQGH